MCQMTMTIGTLKVRLGSSKWTALASTNDLENFKNHVSIFVERCEVLFPKWWSWWTSFSKHTGEPGAFMARNDPTVTLPSPETDVVLISNSSKKTHEEVVSAKEEVEALHGAAELAAVKINVTLAKLR